MSEFFTKKNIFLCILLLLSFLALSTFFFKKDGGTLVAVITVDGNIYQEITLTGHQGTDEIEIKTSRGYNKIVIEDETIYMEDADCHDQICVAEGRAKKNGDVIVCLPHHLLIEVKRIESD